MLLDAVDCDEDDRRRGSCDPPAVIEADDVIGDVDDVVVVARDDHRDAASGRATRSAATTAIELVASSDAVGSSATSTPGIADQCAHERQPLLLTA